VEGFRPIWRAKFGYCNPLRETKPRLSCGFVIVRRQGFEPPLCPVVCPIPLGGVASLTPYFLSQPVDSGRLRVICAA
jgi:hypothetical protein